MSSMLTKEETIRRDLAEQINSDPRTRERLEDLFGKGDVWDTDELRADFEVSGFAAPFCIVTRKKDGVRGILAFQHAPRFYFDFKETQHAPRFYFDFKET